MPLVPCHFDLPISSYGLWLKVPFCWLLKMTYNVEIDNFLWEHFLIIHVKVIPWSISVDFFNCPNKETFAFGWFLSQILRIMISIDQMMFVASKFWCWPKTLKFDCMWVIVYFWSNTVDSQASEQLTEQTSCAKLKIWQGGSWGHIRTMERIWGLWSSPFLMKMETLVGGSLS